MTVSAGRTAPTRHRSAPERSATIGRALRRIAGVEEVDEALMDRIGAAYLTGDDLGADVAAAMRRRPGDPERVALADVRTALAEGVGPHTPPALRRLIAGVVDDPDWLDRDLLAEGARVYRSWGRAGGDVLLGLALIGGYRFGGPTDLLVATGGLVGDRTRQRLAETQHWTTRLSEPGALDVYGEAWRLTLHVRIMHAVVGHAHRDTWDVERWGLPINDADQAATLGLFDAVALLGVRSLGVPVSRADSRAVMHLWRYVGWLLGVPADFLVATERERHRLNYHLLLSQADLTDAGPALAGAIVEVQRHLGSAAGPRWAGALRGTYERERLLSLLSVFLGPVSMRELGLPLRPPWAHGVALAINPLRYRVLPRLPGGRARAAAWTAREVEALLRRYDGADAARRCPRPSEGRDGGRSRVPAGGGIRHADPDG